MAADIRTADGSLPSPVRDQVEVLTLMRFEERELLLPMGVARVEEDSTGRRVLAIRLAFIAQPLFMPLWDLLALVGVDPRSI